MAKMYDNIEDSITFMFIEYFIVIYTTMLMYRVISYLNSLHFH